MTQSELTEPTGAAAEFGELLRQLRLGAGLTQDSLAELAGLSVHGIQKLESGATHPSAPCTAQAVHGIGGALLYPQVLAIVQITFSGDDRAKALGIFGSVIGIAAIAGQ
jgi:DNA-binding XRE family transcriptional regulator